MGKTCKGKEKAAAKVAKAKAKIARKAKGAACALLAFGLATFCGCATSDSQQPAKSATMNNSFEDCIIVVASRATVSNGVVSAKGGDLPTMEIFTQTQSLESSGTESFAQTATQTPTTDIKPDVDVHYNDAIGGGSKVASMFLDSLTAESAALLKSYITQRKSGQVTVTKKDGSTQTLDCKDGVCSPSQGVTITAADCEDCTPAAAK